MSDLELTNVLAKISETFCVSDILSPNCAITSVTPLATSPKFSPAPTARFRLGAMVLRTSPAFSPARLSTSIPSAISVAEVPVVIERSTAFFRNASISSPDACVAAFTPAIALSRASAGVIAALVASPRAPIATNSVALANPGPRKKPGGPRLSRPPPPPRPPRPPPVLPKAALFVAALAARNC